MHHAEREHKDPLFWFDARQGHVQQPWFVGSSFIWFFGFLDKTHVSTEAVRGLRRRRLRTCLGQELHMEGSIFRDPLFRDPQSRLQYSMILVIVILKSAPGLWEPHMRPPSTSSKGRD